ncbi:MAG: hypothetical protein ABIR47_10140 [Candidatus Kapaibacterium sp.]
MSTSSPFIVALRSYLRRAAIVVTVVAVGLVVYAQMYGEPVNWELVGLVAAGMLLSAAANALWDSRKSKVERR